MAKMLLEYYLEKHGVAFRPVTTMKSALPQSPATLTYKKAIRFSQQNMGMQKNTLAPVAPTQNKVVQPWQK